MLTITIESILNKLHMYTRQEVFKKIVKRKMAFLKAKIQEIFSDTHQLQLIKLHHFKIEIFKSIW